MPDEDPSSDPTIPAIRAVEETMRDAPGRPLDEVPAASKSASPSVEDLIRQINDSLNEIVAAHQAAIDLQTAHDELIENLSFALPAGRVTRACIDFLSSYLPDYAAESQNTAAKATSSCELLAYLASALAVMANVVSGSINLALQTFARSIRRPFAATAMELALAAAKEITAAGSTAEDTGQATAETLINELPGDIDFGSVELKLVAVLLRVAGVIACLSEGRTLSECHCAPDLFSDGGSEAVGLVPAGS